MAMVIVCPPLMVRSLHRDGDCVNVVLVMTGAGLMETAPMAQSSGLPVPVHPIVTESAPGFVLAPPPLISPALLILYSTAWSAIADMVVFLKVDTS